MVLSDDIRLLCDPPCDGPTNMARDEALMTLVGSGESPATLRLYTWSEPTISLGYFQKYADYEALEPPAGLLPVVRRLTGGGAILHDRELTYSFALPANHALVKNAPNHLYELVHQAVMASLRDAGIDSRPSGLSDDSSPTRGPFFCFARRHKYDVLVDGDKITGSAQRRTREAVLQHGSIIVGSRFNQQPTASSTTDKDEVAKVLTQLVESLPGHLAGLIGYAIRQASWTPGEHQQWETLRTKYAGLAWTRRT